MIVGLEKGKPHWGARKLRELLLRRLPNDIKPPAVSTTHAVLDRNGLVSHQGAPAAVPRARHAPPGPRPTTSDAPISKASSGSATAKLTVTDHASRHLLLCEALDSVREEPAIAAFEHLFRERGLPAAIRSGNGVPFASPNALFNLSKLAVWRLRLGISIERSSQATRSRTDAKSACT